MKKLTLLLVLLVAAVTASPNVQFASVRQPVQRFQVNRNLTQKDAAAAKNTPARVITEQPEGAAYDYLRSGRATFGSSGGYVAVGNQDGAVRIVYDPDGTTVYVRNLLYRLNYYFGHTWVQGTIADGVLTIPMGQAIYYSPDYNADIVLCWGTTYDNNGQIGFTRDESVTEVTFTVGEDGSLTLNNTVAPTTQDPSVIEAYLGTGLTAYWSDDNSFTGFMNWNSVFSDPHEASDVPTLITEQPEGELLTFIRSDGGCLYNMSFDIGLTEQEPTKVRVVLGEDGKAWIQNPMYWYDNNNTWVEGTYDDATGIITVPVGQYLSYNEIPDYGIQMMWGESVMHQNIDESGETYYTLEFILHSDVEAVEFKIDGNKLLLLDTKGDVHAEWPDNVVGEGLFGMRSDTRAFDALEYGSEASLIKEGPATPADPTDLNWFDSGAERGNSRLDFTLQLTDIDGEALDPENMSYSIFTDDDQLYTFEAAKYTWDRLAEDYTEVPYSVWSHGIYLRGNGCNFYRTNAEGFDPFFTRRIGVQAIYTVDVPEGEGAPKKAPVVNKSNIVYYELPNVAIETIQADANTDAPIYNIMGQKMTGNLPAGIYIQNGKKFIVK